VSAAPVAINVLLVDDHAVVRAGYRHLLARDGRIAFIAEASDAQAAYASFGAFPPDVVVMDLALPDSSGIEVMRRMLEIRADARVLIFSMHEEPIFATRAMQAGARGYVTKSSGPEVLVDAVLAVARGECYVSRDVASILQRRQAAQSEQPGALTPRELEVLRMLARGDTLNQIAERLSISEKTAANYQWLLRHKLDASNNIQLLLRAAEDGLMRSESSAGDARPAAADRS